MPALKVGDIYAQLGLDRRPYDVQLAAAKREGESFGRQKFMASAGLDASGLRAQVAALPSQAGSLISQYSNQIKGAGQGLTLAVTAPLLLSGAAALKFASNMEQSRIAFETLLGSRAKAEAFINDMQAFAKATPFEYTDLQDQAKRLLAYGFAAGQILPMLRDVGDATAALGSGAAGLDAITRALGQIQAKGKASAEEMLQLTEAGVPAWQMLADAMGTSVQDAMAKVTAGQVSAQQTIDAVLTGMEQRYGGLMDKQAKTIGGQFSNLIDSLKMQAAKFGEALFPIVKPAMEVFIALLNVVSGLPKPLLTVIGVLAGGAAALGPTLWAIGSMANGLKALKEFKNVVGQLFSKTAIDAETASVVANTAAWEANAAARGASSGGGYMSGVSGRQALAGPSKVLSGASAAAQFNPVLEAERQAANTTAKVESAASRAGGAFRSMGAGITSAVVALGPYIIAAAAAAAATAGIQLAYNEWQKAEAQAAQAHLDFADTVGKQLDRVARKVGTISDAYKDFANVLAQDVVADLNQTIEEGSKSFLGGPVWFHGSGDAQRQAAEQAKSILEDAQKIMNAGPLSAEGKAKVVDAVSQLQALGTVAAPAVALLSKELLNVDPHALDTAAEKAAALAQAAKDASTMITVMANGVTSTMTVDMAKRMNLLDASGVAINGAQIVESIQKTDAETAAAGAGLVNTLKSIPKNAEEILARDYTGISAGIRKAGSEIASAFADMNDEALKSFAGRTGSVGSIAGSIGAVANALADMPKKAVAPTRQNWVALAETTRSAMNSLLGVFVDFKTKTLGKDTERVGDIGNMAGSLGSLVSGLAGLPKKAVAPARQNWDALAGVVRAGVAQVLSAFDDASTKELGKSAERAGSVGGMASGLSSLVGSLESLPDKAVKVVPEKWRALAQVTRSAVAQVLAVFDDEKTKKLGEDATRVGSIGSAAGGLASLIGALAGLPDKAVSVVPQKWRTLAQVVRSAVGEVLAVFEDESSKKLGKEAGRMGSIAGEAGSLGQLLDFVMNAPKEAVSLVPQPWRDLAMAVRDAVREVVDALDTSWEWLEKQTDKMDLIGKVVGPLAQVLDFFKNAPGAAITVVRQNWGELTATIIEALQEMVTQFDAVWTSDQLKKNAEDLGHVGTMVETIRGILDLASDLPDKLSALEDFSKSAGSLGGIWQGVGNAPLQIVVAISSALEQIPDMSKLAAAQQAVSTLRDIFSSMSDLSKTMGNRLSAGVSGGVALGVAGAAGATQVVLPLLVVGSNLTDRDYQTIADGIRPYLGAGKVAVARTGF